MKNLNQNYKLFERADNFGFILGKIIESRIKLKEEYKKIKVNELI